MARLRTTRPVPSEDAHSTRSVSQLKATERAYHALRDSISQGTLGTDRWYLQEELAATLELSRTPVREALIRLATEGWVTMRPRRGVRVTSISLYELREIYEMTTALEAFAVMRLVERGPSDEDLDELREAQARMEHALSSEDISSWEQADEAFHRGLVNGGGNGQLMDAVDRLWERTRRARVFTARYRTVPRTSNEDHATLLHYIERRDADGAYKVHLNYCRRGLAVIVAVAQSRGWTEV